MGKGVYMCTIQYNWYACIIKLDKNLYSSGHRIAHAAVSLVSRSVASVAYEIKKGKMATSAVGNFLCRPIPFVIGHAAILSDYVYYRGQHSSVTHAAIENRRITRRFGLCRCGTLYARRSIGCLYETNRFVIFVTTTKIPRHI